LNTKKRKDYKIFLFFLLIPVFLLAKPYIINQNPHNAEAVLVFENEKPKYVKAFGKIVPFYKTITNKQYKYYALIPVRYRTKPGLYKLKIVYQDKVKTYNVKVSWGNYKKEKLRVAKKLVYPPKSVLKRIRSEYKEAMKIYGSVIPEALWKHKFSLPLDSYITSPFGSARVFNDKVKSFHTGLDFRAKTGTPVKASNDGVVVLAKNRYFAGNSVIISHGRGIYTCYYHLSKINVKKGESVKKGQVIGLSGKTGRVTGPHLHFTTWLQGVIVNPKVLISLLNQI